MMILGSCRTMDSHCHLFPFHVPIQHLASEIMQPQLCANDEGVFAVGEAHGAANVDAVVAAAVR